jgi:hypothetical protein
MSNDYEDIKARLTILERENEALKNALGAFAVGLDKVSQTQANQTDVIEGLVTANETQAHYLKRLVENTEKHNELLKRLLENKGD